MERAKFVTEVEMFSWGTTRIPKKLIRLLMLKDFCTLEIWDDWIKTVFFSSQEEPRS